MGQTRPIMSQNTNNVTQRRIQRGGETTIVVGEKYCTTVTARSDFFWLKMHKRRLATGPAGAAYSVPTVSLAGLKGAVSRLAKTGKGGRGRNNGGARRDHPPPPIPRSAKAVTLTNALHTRACNQHSTFTSKKLSSPQNSPTKSRDLCYGIYILTAVLLGVLQVCSSLVDCSVLETPPK